MPGREGDGEEGEVSEGSEHEQSLEDYRKGLNEKYGEEVGENKDEPDDASGEGDVKEEEPADNSESVDSARSESGVEKVDNAPERQAGDSSQTGSQHGREPKEEPPSDEKISGGDELESMREHLNERYPGDEKDIPEGEETQPATPSAGENEGGVDPPESSEQQTAGADQAITTEQTQTTAANNAAERPERDLSGQEDVGWETPDGHGAPDKPQDPPKSDEIQPKELGATQEGVGGGDSKQPQNESKEEAAKPAETPPSGETQAGKVEPAKTDADDQSSPNKPLTDNGQVGGERPENSGQPRGKLVDAEDSQTEVSSAAKTEDDNANPKDSTQSNATAEGDSQRDHSANRSEVSSKQAKSSTEEQSKPDSQVDARGGGNQSPEHEKSMPASDGSPHGSKEGSSDNREHDDRQPIVRKASIYMDSLALNIPTREIPKHEDRDDVFEVRISRVSKLEEEYKVYTTHNPNYKRAYLPIRHVGAERGEEFLIQPPEKYEVNGFVRDYNANKPKGLENTSLISRDDKLRLKVGSSELELKDVTLRAQEGKAVLDTRLNDDNKNAVKIAKGVDGFDFRFKQDHAVVISMKESKEGVEVFYQRTQNDIPPHQRLIEVSQTERRDFRESRHNFKIDTTGVSIEKPIKCERDVNVVRISRENGIEAGTYWAHGKNCVQKWHQGDIGEAMANCVLEKSGFKIIREHTDPIRGRIPVHKSENHGMEGVVEKDGRYHVVQTKHWLDTQKALGDAKNDIADFAKDPKRAKLEDELSIKFEGGLAIEVYWSYDKPEAVIYTDYIKF